ncbi:MAG: fumarylacetoacetate hydrolase family protein [Gammaproteobacteria bacterium]|nr:fumarylacetoacetate hydrolase family protein [Gammaproteobacteria bacterium]MBU2057374.1 fumarylacetoacetate hydrolase family protein [Gammaproteobacteria bacterium]MBU2176058.1 fumarylacetoacetate hydrolase family protein [Gammaproteobacteria bacterium]MBU2245246.1 fumarylacetoacetate hydrolase family protein [Gammaproteobacteria bacterium]MBU2344342.1 fumarylacetoacetate hydrolase family protein [Gammaproteobacteria bacterium]
MSYQHKDQQGNLIDLPSGKVLCIGQNYQDHIVEMNSKTAPEALFFIKPGTAVVDIHQPFPIPHHLGDVHNETELAVLIKAPLTKVTADQVPDAIWGYALALDLTLRDQQKKLKELGRPWEIAKGFDGACPVSAFIAADELGDVQQLQFSLKVNGELRQQGDTRMMIRSVTQIISEMSQFFTLLPGDLVLTGTPAGVGPLNTGDQLELTLANKLHMKTSVR